MTIKDKIKNLADIALKNPIKTILAGSLTTLIATTALKDNVHFGSTTFNNCKENQYVWGFFQ